jgi:PadR family transcriptional regulator, regulatory protein AphA
VPKTGPPSSTSFAILGLLSLKSWSTYELAQQVTRSLNWFWPRAQRRLYDEPKLLVAAGLATAEKTWTGRRPRTEYGITDEGRDALRRWLDEAPAPRASESEAMLKVFFADAGGLDQLKRTLEHIEQDTVDQLLALRALLAGVAENGMLFPDRSHLSALTLRLHLDQETAVLRWSRWAQEQVGSWSSAADPGTWDHEAELRSILDQLDDLDATSSS